ncbi:type II toxin-antitoxin system RelE/ParE family toxin [Puniceicoccus vermicola]|uniref:Type II toxin-antitoxin system RelE/ParE family toxin n=1 Tax=Puniceicoccus vermicola TaxID=388746 RepID=A0A7X1B1E7_9BACT|nr:type II toxin-antitoxin system RelE/ParE family toxin [Puniceicoccus vermicola]
MALKNQDLVGRFWVRFTREADEDLVSIARYTRWQWVDSPCRTYIEEIFSLFERITISPQSS